MAQLFNPGKEDISRLFDKIHSDAAPIFVLSTGRCGTQLMSLLFRLNDQSAVYHNNVPELTWYSGYAFHHFQDQHASLKLAIDLARYEQIRNEFLLGKTYIETNNRITFFAYQLAELYPKSKFIHLYRDVYKVVKSGYSRDWYGNSKLVDEGKLFPKNASDRWANYTQVEQIAWLWETTNQFIEEFKSSMDPPRVMTISAEEMFKDLNMAKSLFDFAGLKTPPDVLITNMISKPVNKQTSQERSLSDSDMEAIRKIATLQQRYYSSIMSLMNHQSLMENRISSNLNQVNTTS